MKILDKVSDFVTLEQLSVALNGSYGKYFTNDYAEVVIKALVFVVPFREGVVVKLRNHYPFKYNDEWIGEDVSDIVISDTLCYALKE